MSLLHQILEQPAPEQPEDGRIDDLRTAVRLAEELLAAFPYIEDLHDPARYYAAWAEDELFRRTGDPAHLDREIDHLRAGVLAEVGGMGELLVDALSTRQGLAEDGSVEDIDYAIHLQRTMLAFTDEDDLVQEKARLGMLVAQRFRASPPDDPDQLANLDDAIGLLTEVRHAVPADDPDHARIIAALGHLLVMSHIAPRMGPDNPHTNDLDRGITLLRSVADHNDQAADRLVFALDHRFGNLERPEDRDEAIAIAERLCADDPDYLNDAAEELGVLYLSRLTDAGDQTAFEPAVACLTHTIRQRKPDTEYLELYLIEAYLCRYGRVPPDDELVRLRSLALEMVADEDAPSFWTTMALAIDAELAVANGEAPALRSCVARFTEVVTAPRRPDDDLFTILAVLAAMVAQLHGHGVPWPQWSPFAMLMAPAEHSETLFGWLRRVQDRLPSDLPEYPLSVTGTALLSTDLDRPFADLAADLEYARTTLPAGHPLRHLVTYVLGRGYLGNNPDPATREHSTRTIELLTSAAADFAADDPLRAECVGCLGTAVLGAYTSNFVDRSQIRQADELIASALANPGLDPDFRPLFLMALGQVRGVSWLVDASSGDMDSGVRLHEQALSLLAPDHPLRVDVLFGLSNLLLSRTVITRNLDDVAMAQAHLETLVPMVADRDRTDWASSGPVADLLRVARLLSIVMDDNVSAEDIPELDAIIAAVEAKEKRDPTEEGMLAWARMARARQRGDHREALALMDSVAEFGASVPETFAFKKTFDSVGSMVTSAKAVLAEDMTTMREQIGIVLARAEAPDVVDEERARLLFLASGMWQTAYTKTRDQEYLENAIVLFERCHEIAAKTAEPFSMFAAEQLSELYWQRRGDGDAEQVARWGFAALTEHARQVLLHDEITHGAAKAGTIMEHAHALALRCAAMGDLERAVAAVESGRGLTMYLATAGDEVGAVLRELGHDDVALEWEHSLRDREARPDEVRLPSDLRYRVLALLAGTEAEQRLLSPPAPARIAEALRATGGDALVYLIPAAAGMPGLAIVVDADAAVRTVPLPLLTTAKGSEVERYLTAHRLATTVGPGQANAVRTWRSELDELLWWAWPAVVDPVLTEVERTTGARTPRLVLVPCGALGIVPWQAARSDTGRARFAVDRAVFSYAPSARQLCDAAARPVMAPTEDVTVVANPSEDLGSSRNEAEYLYARLYPNARYYGLLPSDLPQDGEGSPEEVLALLPTERADGMSVLHLACHASTGPTPAESFLELADGNLTVAEMLRHSRGRAKGKSGGLVVLAACQSDLANRDHDEALTVATAFLAGGAASVVGTRWSVADRPSAVLMCLFHRYLVVDGLSPADALRAAQLWAIDRNSVLPADIAEVFGRDRCDIPLTTWAAFSHQGR